MFSERALETAHPTTHPHTHPTDPPTNRSPPAPATTLTRRCVKVICDHLSLGVKTGLPYIWHSKASDPFVNLRKEYKGIFWQEEIIPFFQQVRLSSAPSLIDSLLDRPIEAENNKTNQRTNQPTDHSPLAPRRKSQIKLDAVKHADVFSCYEELAEQLRQGLGHLDPYFDRLADAMLAWIACWRQLNPAKEAAEGGAAVANGNGKAHA